MDTAEKVTALLALVTRGTLADMTPALRRRLTDHCRYIVAVSDMLDKTAPKSGVLAQLDEGTQTD